MAVVVAADLPVTRRTFADPPLAPDRTAGRTTAPPSYRIARMVRWCGALLVALVGCSSSPPVGPAPLRRLSNTEYLYALADLFPDQHPTLPPLPADSAVTGFDNDADAQAPSDVRITRYEAIANLYAAGATRDLTAVRTITGCDDWSTPAAAAACRDRFLAHTGGRIFRRPLTAEETTRFTVRFDAWAAAVDFPGAVQLALSAMLQSPQFLYRAEPVDRAAGSGALVPVEPYAMASRLSFFLWESVPDDELLRVARNGGLQTEASVRAQAERMLADPRAQRLAWDFHRQWLALDRVMTDEHVARTPEIDPGWSEASQGAALGESRRFVEHSFAEAGTFVDLMTSRRAWVDGETARLYGVAGPADPTAVALVELPADQRAGLLTRVAFLAGTSHPGGTSPPIRGNAIQLRLLCQLPAPPPDGADLSMPVASPGQGPQTNRMLFEERTRYGSCPICHTSLNGFGFGLEHYTAAGSYVTSQVGLPIDASGRILGTDVDGPYRGGVELSAALARSKDVYRCASQQWLRYALGRAPTDDEATVIDAIASRFAATGGDLRGLLVDIVTSETFRMRRAAAP